MSTTHRTLADAATPGTTMRPRPRPFLRQSLTIVPSWEPDPVTVEVIAIDVAARGCPGEEGTSAAEWDLPELGQDGWQGFIAGALNVYVRIIGKGDWVGTAAPWQFGRRTRGPGGSLDEERAPGPSRFMDGPELPPPLPRR